MQAIRELREEKGALMPILQKPRISMAICPMRSRR